MERRRILEAAGILLVLLGALVPLIVLRTAFVSDDPRSALTPSLEPVAAAPVPLPWPYCAPDATPPPRSPTPWPPLPPIGPTVDRPAANAPVGAQALLVATRVTPLGEPDPPRSDNPGWQLAEVEVLEVAWETSDPIEPSIGTGRVTVYAHSEAWSALSDALAGGSTGVVVVGPPHPDGSYSVRFTIGIDGEQRPTFFGRQPFAERDTLILRAFLDSDRNPMPGADFMDLLVAWNTEDDSESGRGPFSEGWEAFVKEQVLQITTPRPRTLEWWNEATANCRFVAQAPESVLEGLIQGTVWVHAPDSWQRLADGVLCLRIEGFATLSCTNWEHTPGWDYVSFIPPEVSVPPGSDIQIEVAALLEGAEGKGPSWVERVTLGTIPWGVFAGHGLVLVELDPTGGPVSYAELKADPDASSAATAESMSAADERALIETAPKATPESG